MFDLSLLFIFQNIIILLLVFWVLAWLGEKFFKIKFHKNTTVSYECGFINIQSNYVSLNFSFFFLTCLLIIYDIEFLFLIPFYFNMAGYTLISVLIYWVFFIFIFISLFIDWRTVLIDWLLD